MGKTIYRDINPKSITSNELYGFINLSTREWKDGLLSSCMRDLANMPDTNPKWIILDGPSQTEHPTDRPPTIRWPPTCR